MKIIILKVIVYSGLAIVANLVGTKLSGKAAEEIKNLIRNGKK